MFSLEALIEQIKLLVTEIQGIDFREKLIAKSFFGFFEISEVCRKE